MVDKNPSPRINRRKVLKSSAVGIGSLALTGSANATSTDDPETSVQFVEAGIRYKSNALDESYHIDQFSLYHPVDDGLYYSAVKPSTLEKFKDEDTVVKFRGYHSLPTVVNKGRISSIPIGTTQNFEPTKYVSLKSEIQSVPIRLKSAANNAVEVKVGGNKQTISADDSEKMDLNPKPVNVLSKGDKSNNHTVTPEVEVKNRGEVDIFVENVIGGGK